MARSKASLNTIESFLQQKRLAVVGISRDRQSIGVALVEELRRRGYDLFLVNPNTPEILGQKCFARVQEIQPPPEAALILTAPSITDSVVRDCAEAGVRSVWMFRGGGKGSVSASAVEYCRAQGIELVPGECPFMFLDPVRSIHRFHRFLVKITGKYPRRLGATTA